LDTAFIGIVALVIIGAWGIMVIGIILWSAKVRRLGAALMMGAGGAAAGFLGTGLIAFLVFYSSLPIEQTRPVTYSEYLQRHIIRDPAKIGAPPEPSHSARWRSVGPLVGLIILGAGFLGGIFGVRYARTMTS
jgi:hypothetical protein